MTLKANMQRRLSSWHTDLRTHTVNLDMKFGEADQEASFDTHEIAYSRLYKGNNKVTLKNMRISYKRIGYSAIMPQWIY